MFKNLREDIFSPYSSFGLRCITVFLLLFILAMFCLLGLLGFIAVDTFGVQGRDSTLTRVDEKRMEPPYKTFVLVGKVPVVQYHPTSYWLHFKIDGNNVKTSVEEEFYNNVHVGGKIKVEYGFTRLSNSHRPTRIALATN